MANWPVRGVYRDSSGNAVASPTVTVVNAGTATPTTIFSDRSGTALTNPFTGDADGEWEFYAPSGTEVDITVSKVGYATWTALWHLVGGGGDHGALSGLEEDDHEIYSLVDGSRAFTSTPGGIDHGSIGGLLDDDHSQHPLLAGRSGGQSLRGGTAASENLTLASTAHATKGKVLFGSVAAMDEVNSRFGVGTTSPSNQLHVRGTGSTFARVESSAAAAIAQIILADSDQDWRIGKASDDSFQLIDNTGSTVPLRISPAALTDSLRIDSSGRVGINNSSPSRTHHISGIAAATGMETAGNPVFNVKHPSYGAVGDNSTNDATAIQAAIDACTAAKGGVVYFPPGRYVITSGLVLKKGVILQGVDPGVVTSSYNNWGSTIVAGGNLTNMIATNLVTAEQGMGIRNLGFDGQSATRTVTTALDLYGRSVRMENVKVDAVTGRAFRLRPSGGGGEGWVHWVTNCAFNAVGGALVENTDSWFIGNYFSACPVTQQSTGGNVWMGNHFDNAPAATAGLKIQSTSAANQFVTQIIGNYFDVNDNGSSIGLLFTSHDGSTQYEWHATVQGNTFRANEVDIRIEDAIKCSIQGSEHYSGASTVNGIVFDNCDGGMLSGVQWNATGYSAFFSGKPANVSLRGCYTYESGGTELRSEASGSAVVLEAANAVTVTHGLLGTPNAVVVSGAGGASTGGADCWVSNVTSTQFTINIETAAPAGGRTVYWIAWYTK